MHEAGRQVDSKFLKRCFSSGEEQETYTEVTRGRNLRAG